MTLGSFLYAYEADPGTVRDIQLYDRIRKLWVGSDRYMSFDNVDLRAGVNIDDEPCLAKVALCCLINKHKGERLRRIGRWLNSHSKSVLQ